MVAPPSPIWASSPGLQAHAGPGHWVPTSKIVQQQTPLLPDWGKNRPFAMPTGADCELPPRARLQRGPELGLLQAGQGGLRHGEQSDARADGDRALLVGRSDAVDGRRRATGFRIALQDSRRETTSPIEKERRRRWSRARHRRGRRLHRLLADEVRSTTPCGRSPTSSG